jgi:hypothetical protein
MEEQRAEDVDDGKPGAVRARDDREPASRCQRRRVRRSQDAIGGVEIRRDLGAAERVVPQRDRVDSGREEPVGEARRDPDPVGDVLPVRDAEVDLQVGAQRRQTLLERLPAGGPDDVGDEQNAQGAQTLKTRYGPSVAEG